jgi:hypothetical protein
MIRFPAFIFLCLVLFSFRADDAYNQEIQAFRNARLNSLKSENGWLNLAGLFWLKEGINSFGSDEKNDFVFPKDHSDPFLGELLLKDGKVFYQTVSDTMLVYRDDIQAPVV